ncbi:hypothetical protein ACLMJK_008669 [Lecanora helva]
MEHAKSSFQEHVNEDSSYKIGLPEQSPPEYTDQQEAVSPMSNRVSSPGLEFVRRVVVTGNGAEEATPESPEKEAYTPYHPPPENDGRASKSGSGKRKWLLALLALLVIIAIALGVGLGVGLTRKNSTSTSNKAELSTIGAFNGSGIALASQSFASAGYGSIVMYFQHHTGQLRSAQLATDGSWRGGDVTEVVAADAKNGTPIAAVAYAKDEIAAWHLFYINTDNFISEITNSNTTNVWAPGPINDLKLKALDDPHVGLQACWYGGFYSDVTYNHSPVPGQSNKTGDSTGQNVGINLWYASTPTTFESISWTYGQKSWTPEQSFDGYNGHAGVGCYSWGPGSDTYVFFTDLNNNINILWKDLNTTLQNTTTHPINIWTKTPVTIPVFQNTSIGYTNYLYIQSPDLSISGYNVTWAAENTSVAATDPDQSFTINGDKGLPGTHLSVTALPNKSGGNSLLAFYQTNGSDVTEFVRDLDGGQWTSSSVPIPEE